MSSRFIFLAMAVGAALSGVSPSLAASDKPAASAPTAGHATTSPAPVKRIDINSASRAQLKTLPGIGDAEADRIIAARPYPSKAKLGAERVVSDQTYFAIKDRIVAVQPEAPKAKAESKATPKP